MESFTYVLFNTFIAAEDTLIHRRSFALIDNPRKRAVQFISETIFVVYVCKLIYATKDQVGRRKCEIFASRETKYRYGISQIFSNARSPFNAKTLLSGDVKLPTNMRQRVANGTLFIDTVQRSADEGTYTCTARNKHNFTSHRSVEVRVLGKQT